MFINIHTHKPNLTLEWAIQNLYSSFGKAKEPGSYSIGLHPWYIDEHWLTQFQKIKEYSNLKNVIAIGEAGLDKICKTDWHLQQEVFIQQIRLANELNKPLIIHCVKAWEEVLSILIKEKVKVPVIFHGFTKNKLLAKRITEKGFYVSFGKSLQNNSVKEVLASVPQNKFLLETDDADISIASVYDYAATALSIDVNSLSLQIEKNALAIFGNTVFQL